MDRLTTLTDAVETLDGRLDEAIQAHLDDLTKPPGSLGALERLAARYCRIRGSAQAVLGGKTIVTFAGDHGVADEGVSAYPKAVTPQMVRNMLAGGAAINALAGHAGADLVVVDMGVDDPLDGAPGLRRRKIANGTCNIAKGPAMTVDQALLALEAGAELARQAVGGGATLLGTGEMGIANTTPASALMAALLPCPVEVVVGRGTGIDDERLAHKTRVVQQALDVNREDLGAPLETLAALGGFEIAGIAGLVLGAAAERVPVVVDGFISSAGALAAWRLCPAVGDYLYFSHLSEEAGHRVFYETLGVEPLLDLGLRLGEGTGAALAMTLIEASMRVYGEMATFSSAGVSDKE